MECVDSAWDRSEREQVLAYLAATYEAPYLVPYSGVWCAFGCLNPRPRGIAMLTDGTWWFPEILVHYVSEHLVNPPMSFWTTFVAWPTRSRIWHASRAELARLPNQRLKLSARGGRLVRNRSILSAAAAGRSLSALR